MHHSHVLVVANASLVACLRCLLKLDRSTVSFARGLLYSLLPASVASSRCTDWPRRRSARGGRPLPENGPSPRYAHAHSSLTPAPGFERAHWARPSSVRHRQTRAPLCGRRSLVTSGSALRFSSPRQRHRRRCQYRSRPRARLPAHPFAQRNVDETQGAS